MFVRMLLVTVSLCAALAVGGVAAAPAKDGIKFPTTADPIPPITQVPLPFTCRVTFEGSIAYLECHNTVSNPNPPKDETTIKIDRGHLPGNGNVDPRKPDRATGPPKGTH